MSNQIKLGQKRSAFFYFTFSAAFVLSLAAISVGVCSLSFYRHLNKAEAYLKSGFGALAAEKIDWYRCEAVKSERGCRTLIQAYYLSRRFERLQWAAEACADAKIDIPEIYLGSASVAEIAGDTSGALQILNAAAPKFKSVSSIYLKMAGIYIKAKQPEQAKLAMLRAVEQEPQSSQLAFTALQFFSDGDFVNEARQMADRLKNAQGINNPELKLVIARALKRGGDSKGADAMVSDAKTLASPNPEILLMLQKAYPDLLPAPK